METKDIVAEFQGGMERAMAEQRIIAHLEMVVAKAKLEIAKTYSYSETDATIAVTMWENGFRTAEIEILKLFGRL